MENVLGGAASEARPTSEGAVLVRRERGAAMIEFALISILLYLLVAGGVELGREIMVAQVLQDAARVAARELAVTPLPAAWPNDPDGYYYRDCPVPTGGNAMTFEDALCYHDREDTDPANCGTPVVWVDPAQTRCFTNPSKTVDVRAQIWDPNIMVINLKCFPDDPSNSDPLKRYPLQRYMNSLPIVNRALQPLFISDTIGFRYHENALLRYPGALVQGTGNLCPAHPVYDGTTASDLVVAIYQVSYAGGGQSVDPVPLPIITEVRSQPKDRDCGAVGPFVLTVSTPPSGCDATASPPGMVALAINYPFQSAALSGFRSGGFGSATSPDPGAPMPNVANVIESPDCPPGSPASCAYETPAGEVTNNVYSGPNGLGNQYAFAKTVRPYRSLIFGQAIFRREVFQ